MIVIVIMLGNDVQGRHMVMEVRERDHCRTSGWAAFSLAKVLSFPNTLMISGTLGPFYIHQSVPDHMNEHGKTSRTFMPVNACRRTDMNTFWLASRSALMVWMSDEISRLSQSSCLSSNLAETLSSVLTGTEGIFSTQAGGGRREGELTAI